MPLCTPDIQGPVSILSTDIRVTAQLSGATVTISSIGQNPRLIAHGVATSGDQRFLLDSGVHLDATDELIAMQTMGSESSPPTPADFAVGVEPLPQSASEVAPVAFETHLYECGQNVWISGAVPGAPVKVLDQANQNFVYGSGFSQEGDAHLTLTTVLPSSKAVLGVQELPNLQGLTPTAVTTDSLPPGARPSPPPPAMAPPLVACQPSVLVSAVYDGATVTLDHKGGESDVYGFDTDTAWAVLPNPLMAGDTLASRQDFAGPARGPCNIHGQELNPPLPVGLAQQPNTPTLGPICAGTRKITVANLSPGAVVTLTVDGQQWLGQVPPDVYSYTFTVSPVQGGQVNAKQTFCSIDSQEASVSVDPHEVITSPPTLQTPLFACARAIFVKDVHPGAQLQAFAVSHGQTFPISALITATDTEATLDVAPFLILNSQVFVAEWACGGTKLLSNPQPPPTVVQPQALAEPVILPPIISGLTFVDVTMYLPGARIDVYVAADDAFHWIYSGHALGTGLDSKTRVFLFDALKLNYYVAATQSLCNQVSDTQTVYQVAPPPPETPQLIFPANGTSNVPTKPTFVWQDPGAATDAKATSFDFQVLQGNQGLWSSAQGLTSTSVTPPITLAQGNQFSWKVRGTNSTGSSQFATAMFSTVAPPPPPKPSISISPSQPSNTFTISGHDFKPNDIVHFQITISANLSWGAVDVRDFYPATVADGSGNLTSLAVDLVQLSQNTNQPLQIPDNNGGFSLYYGAYPGEHVGVVGIDSRAGGSYASQWASNTVSYTAS